MFQISDCDAHKTTYLDLFLALFGESLFSIEKFMLFLAQIPLTLLLAQTEMVILFLFIGLILINVILIRIVIMTISDVFMENIFNLEASATTSRFNEFVHV